MIYLEYFYGGTGLRNLSLKGEGGVDSVSQFARALVVLRVLNKGRGLNEESIIIIYLIKGPVSP